MMKSRWNGCFFGSDCRQAIISSVHSSNTNSKKGDSECDVSGKLSKPTKEMPEGRNQIDGNLRNKKTDDRRTLTARFFNGDSKKSSANKNAPVEVAKLEGRLTSEGNSTQIKTVPRSAFDILLDARRRSNVHSYSKIQNEINRKKALTRSATANPSTARTTVSTVPSSSILLKTSQEVLTRRKTEDFSSLLERSATDKYRRDSAPNNNYTLDERLGKPSNALLAIEDVDKNEINRSSSSKVDMVRAEDEANQKRVTLNAVSNSGPSTIMQREVIYDQRNAHTTRSASQPIIKFDALEAANELSLELRASREVNKDLLEKLAKSEREVHDLKIQLQLQEPTIEARIASRMADFVTNVKLKELSKERNVKESIDTSERRQVADNDGSTTKTVEDWLNEIEGTGLEPLSPETIRLNCERMMSYVKEHGCRTSNGNAEMITSKVNMCSIIVLLLEWSHRSIIHRKLQERSAVLCKLKTCRYQYYN
ncbi:hypothetical protein AB6A40_001569 [Gnathostoma spinigerum]|uniref:Uncharacterized protein n=1 Tax=Gnathostoma spinigerum TaxID=75299 RepID=A0ABD6E5H0_9BILA